jgi:glycosyltransferase involved in cell wall biosynthesis
MNFLFIHQNSPGQFVHLAKKLSSLGHQVRFLSLVPYPSSQNETFVYSITRQSTENIHPWMIDFESQLIRAEGVLNYTRNLRNAGYSPDVIYFHPGWGEAFFLNLIWPDCKKIAYCEYYYNVNNFDVGYDPEFGTKEVNIEAKIQIKNLANEMQFPIADIGICPTYWQKSSYPKHFQEKIHVVHDGIDTAICKPKEDVFLEILRPDGIAVRFDHGDPILTFVNRNLEPYRGYPSFMRALPFILQAIPNLQVLIIGGDGRGYGGIPEQGGSWKNLLLKEVYEKIDLRRLHFLGMVDYESYLKVLQLSTVHIYLTYPFVLSWSLLEAMSVGTCIVGSDTGPVREIIKNEQNGVLVDFFDHQGLAQSVIDLFKNPLKRAQLGQLARKTICHSYDLNTVCLPKQIALIESLF